MPNKNFLLQRASLFGVKSLHSAFPSTCVLFFILILFGSVLLCFVFYADFFFLLLPLVCMCYQVVLLPFSHPRGKWMRMKPMPWCCCFAITKVCSNQRTNENDGTVENKRKKISNNHQICRWALATIFCRVQFTSQRCVVFDSMLRQLLFMITNRKCLSIAILLSCWRSEEGKKKSQQQQQKPHCEYILYVCKAIKTLFETRIWMKQRSHSLVLLNKSHIRLRLLWFHIHILICVYARNFRCHAIVPHSHSSGRSGEEVALLMGCANFQFQVLKHLIPGYGA